MTNLRDWKLRLRALFSPHRVERELDEELSFHIERETQRLVAGGMSLAEAHATALRRFGPVPLAADECRDERGTTFIDDTIRDVHYALRTFKRAPLVAFTIVTTVALGLGVVAVLFTILNVFLFRVDQVPHIHELFAVERPRNAEDERERFTRPQFEALRRETSVFTDAYAELPDIDSRIDGRMMSGALVSGNFFQVAGVNAAMGRTLTPADDERSGGQPVMVLSHRGWDRHFKKDPAILGRRLIVGGAPYEIIGVMPEGFRGLAVSAPDYWAPLSLVGQFRPIHQGREDRVGLDIVGRLRPGMTRATAQAGLAVWDSGSASTTDRRTNIVLVPRRGTVPQPMEALILFAPLFFSFGLILMIGCANVANLLLARAVARQKEIGVRLSLGATRRRIVRQLLTESLLLALVAAAGGFGISRLALATVVYAVTTSIPPDIGNINFALPAADWRVGLFLIAGALVSTIFFALAPALRATRIEPVKTIRGEIVKDARPGRARNFLIGLQVSASALLLICSAVFLRSAFASATVDPGLRTADTMVVEIANEPTRVAMVRAVSEHPSVNAVAAAWPDLLGRPRTSFAQAGGVKSTVGLKFVSPEYFSVLDIAVVRGRGFAADERTSGAAVAIVSESVARALWPDGKDVGQVMQLDADPNSPTRREDEPTLAARSLTVVGVVRDVTGFRLADFREAGVYVPINAAVAKTGLIVRVNGDSEIARQALLERLTIVDPNMGQIVTMRTVARMETYLLQVAFWVTVVLGGLALLLTVSGLFSVLSYLVEQRTKEIGVRMALGATGHHVTRMVLSQSFRPVAIGLLIGAGLAVALATLLLATPAAAPIGQVIHVLDPVAYAVSLLAIVAACLMAASIPASRAAKLDPMRTLRED